MTSTASRLIASGGSASSAIDLGKAELNYDETNKQLLITYSIEDQTPGDSRDDWSINDFHFDFGKTLDAIPRTKVGNPTVGLFDYSSAKTTATYSPDRSSVTFTVNNVDEGDFVKYWAAHSVVSQRDAIRAFNESLPDTATISVKYPFEGSSSYLQSTISGSSETWLNGTFQGWCIDTGNSIGQNTAYPAKVYSSLEESSLSGFVYKWDNMNAVNWLLNNFKVDDTLTDEWSYGEPDAEFSDYVNGGPLETDSITGVEGTNPLGQITYGDIQRAIWALIEDGSGAGLGSYEDARADELADRAYFFGRNYTPSCNDKAAVVFRPVNGASTSAQVTIAQVTIASPGGSCDGRQETAWGVTGGIPGLSDGMNNFSKSTWSEYNVANLV